MARLFYVSVFVLYASSCTADEALDLLPYTEAVLQHGMSISATNNNGSITITAGEGTKRSYESGEWKEEKYLIPRKERWYGSLGLYDPAASNVPYGRLLVDEGRLHFSSISEALKYLYVGSTFYQPVYTNSGLVFGFHLENMGNKEPIRSVRLWQIYVNGKRPVNIPGADDEAIKVLGGTIPDQSMPYLAPIGYELTLGEYEYQPRKAPNQAPQPTQ